MPYRRGYKKVRAKKGGKTFMAPKTKSKSKPKVKKLGTIYASCRSGKAHSADTHENKRYCASVAHAKSGA
jgi:hypothetical protein